MSTKQLIRYWSIALPQTEEVSTVRRVIEDEAGRRIDGHGASIRRGVWDLTSVELEGVELGFSKAKRLAFQCPRASSIAHSPMELSHEDAIERR